MTKNKSAFIRVPMETAINIPEKQGIYELIKGNYWALTAKNELLLMKRGGKFCNQKEELVKRFVTGNSNSPAIKVVYLENVWLPYKD